MGYLDADIALGNMYEFGRGVSQDYQKAIEYYSKAVDQDYSRGYYSLATLYKSGLGVEKDTPLALKYYSLLHNALYQQLPDNIELPLSYPDTVPLPQNHITPPNYT